MKLTWKLNRELGATRLINLAIRIASFLRASLSVDVARSDILQLSIPPELSLSKITKTAPSAPFFNSKGGYTKFSVMNSFILSYDTTSKGLSTVDLSTVELSIAGVTSVL